jgi:hypothetical protein
MLLLCSIVPFKAGLTETPARFGGLLTEMEMFVDKKEELPSHIHMLISIVQSMEQIIDIVLINAL